MAAITRILYATDFSSFSAPAWEFARRLAGATGARLVVVHAVPWIPVPIEGAFDARTYQRLVEESRAEALAELQRLAAAAGSLRVEVRVEDGPAPTALLAAAEREGADLLVVGTHGRTGLNRLLVGSVAEHVIELATRPVVTVRPLSTPPGAVDRPIRRVVYPTDFSPPSRKAWPWVRRLAEATGAEVDLVHVLATPVPDRHVDPALLARAAEAIRAEAEQSVRAFLDGCGLARERVHVHLAHGEETGAIVHRADALRADLIVIGTHGRTGVLRLALGSVARRILHAAPCPVLTVGAHVAADPPA
jgi:nucleotide-binding universal stress UspA family protein